MLSFGLKPPAKHIKEEKEIVFNIQVELGRRHGEDDDGNNEPEAYLKSPARWAARRHRIDSH